MKKSHRRALGAACLALAALVVGLGPSTSARAQSWPAKPIRVINPWAAGGAADALARPVLQKLSESLGQPVVVENRPGASGTIGAAAVAKAPPDGYTLLVSSLGPTALAPALRRQMPYDPVKDFQPVTQLISGPLVLVVRADSPFATLSDLIARAKANPGKLSYASVGAGSTTHLAAEMLSQLAGIRMLHVPYKGAAPVLTDLVGGQIDFAFVNVSGAVPFLNPPQLRALGVTTTKRVTALPAVPTLAETLPGFDVDAWWGIDAPAGTPRDVVDRLSRELIRILRTPEITRHLNDLGLEIAATTPEEHAAKIRADRARWAEVVKATGLKLD